MTIRIADVRRKILRRIKPRKATLGDANGTLFATGDPIGTIRIRYQISSSADGQAQYSEYSLVNTGANNYPNTAGRSVWVGQWYDGQLAVMGVDHDDARQAGFDTRALSPNLPQRHFVDLNSVTRLMSRPVGNAFSPSFLVQVRPAKFHRYGDYVSWVGTRDATEHVDLAPFVPAVGEHCIVVVWLSLLTLTAGATASTPKLITSAITDADYNEAFEDAPFEPMPVQAYLLQNDQADITARALDVDLRQFLHMPDEVGVPIVTKRRYNVRANRRVLTYGTITVDKTFLNEGSVTIL